jgi:hypothetical protein
MTDPSPIDEHQPPAPGRDQAPNADAAVESIIAAAQESAGRLESAAAELHERARADAAATRREYRDQHEHHLEGARLAIRSLMSQLEAAQANVLKSTERVRRVADDFAQALEHAASEQLQALREQLATADEAIDLIAVGVSAGDTGEELITASARAETESDSTDGAADTPVAAGEPAPADENDTPSPAALLEEDKAPVDEADAEHDQASDASRARLIAVNMALNGVPRDETAQHLRENFELSDEQMSALLDDVCRLTDDAD